MVICYSSNWKIIQGGHNEQRKRSFGELGACLAGKILKDLLGTSSKEKEQRGLEIGKWADQKAKEHGNWQIPKN